VSEVFDHVSNQVVSIPDGQLATAWRAGKVSLLPDATYHVQLPSGGFASLKGSGNQGQALITAIHQGGDFVSKSQVDADLAASAPHVTAPKPIDQDSGALQGFANHAFDQLSGGLYSQGVVGAAGLIGGSDLQRAVKEGAQATDVAHPYATLAGDVAGGIGQAALLPELGVERGIIGGGEALLGKSLAAKLATHVAAKAVEGAGIGAAYGATRSVADNAIRDTPLDAEHVLSSIGGNAGWGALAGGALGAAGGLFKGVRGLSSVASVAEHEHEIGPAGATGPKPVPDLNIGKHATGEDMASVVGKVLGVEPAEGVGQELVDPIKNRYANLAKTIGAVREKDPEKLAKLITRETEPLLQKAEEARTSTVDTLKENLSKVLDAGDAIHTDAEASINTRALSKAMGEVNPIAAKESAQNLTMSAVQGMADIANDHALGAPSMHLVDAVNEAKRITTELAKAGKPAEQFALVDDLRKSVARLAEEGKVKGSTYEQAQASKLGDIADTLSKGLKDPSVWGKAAENQDAMHAAWANQEAAKAKLLSALGRGGELADDKIERYGKTLLNPKNDLVHQALQGFADATRTLTETAGDYYELSPEQASKLKELGKATSTLGDTVQKASTELTKHNQIEAFLKKISGQEEAEPSGLAGLVGKGIEKGADVLFEEARKLPFIGRPITAVKALTDVYLHPAEAVAHAAHVESTVRKGVDRITRTLRSFQAGKARPIPEVDVETYARRAGEVQRAASDPNIKDTIGQNLSRVGSLSPKLMSGMTVASLAGLKFLQSKLPPTLPADPLDPNAKDPLPPKSQRTSFLESYKAVRDPLSVVESLRDGRLSLEGVEVLKTVYPNLYMQVQTTTMDELASGRMKDLSAQQRLGLGVMLDLPIPELAPSYIQARQKAFGPVQSQAQADNSGPPRRGKPVNLAKTQPTLAADRVEGGGSEAA